MRDGPTSGSESRRLTRRGLLAAVGMSALAGCSSLDGLGSGSSTTISTFELPDVDPEDEPDSVIAPTTPVNVDPAFFARSRDRVNEFLAELPTPLGPADIPNGYVRTHLTDAADAATDGLDAARTARTGLAALRALRGARAHARYAAAGWALADRGLSASELRQERQRVVADARSVQQAHEYVGTNLVRATLVHARIEEWLAHATEADGPRVHDAGDLLTVAEWGEAVESARAHLDDATHVAERFQASLPDDAGTVDDTLTEAADALVAAARSQRSDLQPEPTAEEWGLAERVVADLRSEVEYGLESVAEADGPASAIVDLTDRLAWFRALERVRERVDAGEIARVERADQVRSARTEAYDALDAALGDSPDTDLARTVLSDLSWRVVSADEDIARSRSRGEVSAASLDDVMEHYIVTTAVARATPAACRQTVDALETA